MGLPPVAQNSHLYDYLGQHTKRDHKTTSFAIYIRAPSTAKESSPSVPHKHHYPEQQTLDYSTVNYWKETLLFYLLLPLLDLPPLPRNPMPQAHKRCPLLAHTSDRTDCVRVAEICIYIERPLLKAEKHYRIYQFQLFLYVLTEVRDPPPTRPRPPSHGCRRRMASACAAGYLTDGIGDHGFCSPEPRRTA